STVTGGITLLRFDPSRLGPCGESRRLSMTTTTAGRRVLVVDDDRALRHAIASLLQAAGYRTDQAGDGPQALEQLQRQPVDLVLLDIGLPGMSGLDVLARARAAASAPRVVMMTADDTPEALLRSFRGQA